MKAFKTYEQCPLDQRPSGIPLEWPWNVLTIPEEKQSEFESGGFIVLSEEDFSTYKSERQEEFYLWANAYDLDRTGQALRVVPLVRDEFVSYHPSKIDFRRHLKETVYLQKNVTMHPNGRPQKSEYSFEGNLIAEIEFVFETNAYNFMTRRKEFLSYYKNNGTKFGNWLIADDIYDSANPYHLREMMKERSDARAMIFEEVKAFLNGVFASYYVPQGKTYAEILVIAGDLWNKFSTDIDAWINVGSPKFAQNLTTDTDFEILDVEIAEDTTLREWILEKVSY